MIRRAALLLLLGVAAVTSVSACADGFDAQSADPVAPVQMPAFTELRVADGIEVDVERGSGSTVALELEGIARDRVVIGVQDGVLELRTRGDSIPATARMSADIVTPGLVSVTATSGAKVELADDMTLGDQDAALDLTTAAEFTGMVSTRDLEVRMQAGARADLSGSARTAAIVGADSSEFKGVALEVAQASVDLTTAATAELTVNQTLEPSLSSGSTLRYAGEPRIKRKRVDTGATLERIP